MALSASRPSGPCTSWSPPVSRPPGGASGAGRTTPPANQAAANTRTSARAYAVSRAATPMPVTSVPVFNGRPCPELCFSSVGTTWGYTRLDRPGSCSKGDHAVVARRSPARHARVTPASRHGDRPPGRPGDPAVPRPRSPPVARSGDHRGRGDPARAGGARSRRRGRLRARTLRFGHQLDRPLGLAGAPRDRVGRRPARLRLHPSARGARLHAVRARRRAAALARRARPSRAPAGQLARRRDRAGGGGPVSRACAFAHVGLARHARLPARPAPGVGPTADPLRAAGPARVGAPAKGSPR